MVLRLTLIILIFTFAVFIEINPLVQKNLKKEVIVVSILFFISFLISIVVFLRPYV